MSRRRDQIWIKIIDLFIHRESQRLDLCAHADKFRHMRETSGKDCLVKDMGSRRLCQSDLEHCSPIARKTGERSAGHLIRSCTKMTALDCNRLSGYIG